MTIGLETRDPDAGKIYQLLSESQTALSVSEIRLALKLKYNRAKPDYQITKYLRELSREGISSYFRGKWLLSQQKNSQPRKVINNQIGRVTLPALSALGVDALNENAEKKIFIKNDSFEEKKIEENFEHLDLVKGPWARFRKLIGYYKECIRNEEGAEASAFLDDFGCSYIYYSKFGDWYPKPGKIWNFTVPLGPHLSELIRAIESAGEDLVVVLGYPLQGVYIAKDDQPDLALIRPIFQYQLKARYKDGTLTLATIDSRPSVNLEWLKYAFQSPGQQKNFLAACGLLTNTYSDALIGSDVGHDIPRLDTMAIGVSAFLADKIKEPLQINAISKDPLEKPFETGIYNKAVIMIGKKTRYTKRLISELTEIGRSEDSVLDTTALTYIFKEVKEDQSDDDIKESSHESCVIDTDLLNMEQRQAIAALLNQNISVITGPPGTGKSQVVSSAIMNLRLKGRTCIFASRNHKAIDAVVNRCRDKENQSLIIRTNSKEDPSLKYTFVKAVRDLLAITPDLTSKKSLVSIREIIVNCLKERGEAADLAYMLQSLRDQAGIIEEKMSAIKAILPDATIRKLDKNYYNFPTRLVKITSLLSEKHQQQIQRYGKVSIILALPVLITIAPLLLLILAQIRYKELRPQRFIPTLTNSFRRREYLSKMLLYANYGEFKFQEVAIEKKIKDLPPLETLTNQTVNLSKKIADHASQALSLDLKNRNGIAPNNEIREELASLKVALNSIEKGIVTEKEKQTGKRVLKRNIPLLLSYFPCWAVTNLSVGSRIPLVSGMFDLAIIDEASQSDIASAIPILFRAKRAAVVGDPQQLTHSSKLSAAKETLLRKSNGLVHFEDLKYSYSDTSLYDLFAQKNSVTPIFLSSTYRSVDSIAEYSNTTFYDGRLRVATDHSKLKVPKNLKLGIHWTDIAGEVSSAGGGGCYCLQEIDAIVQLIKDILRLNHFRGTLGVVTPFRQQANRINDALYESGLTFEELERAQVHVDTSHGFQGDEKDVILFSICAGPDMPKGSSIFLRETANLFNVAASRARAVLHVFGNKNWAEHSGIKHIQNLARPVHKSQTHSEKGKWYPHESPWEKILFEALVSKGLKPIPQYPVSGRRLDIALVDPAQSAVKIDIEIDGDRYHRNRDGSRKTDDVWRDIQIQGLGWIVMRFWVYELREDLNACVEKIVRMWRENER